jgi:thioredoxin 1
MNKTGKILIVIALIVVIALVIIFKNKQEKEVKVVENVQPEKVILPSLDSLAKQEEIPQNDVVEEPIEKELPGQKAKSSTKKEVKAHEDVLAVVEGEKITKTDFEKSFNALPTQHKDMFKANKDGYLEQMITKELLFQQAQKEGFTDNSTPKEKQMDEAIQKFFAHLSSDIDIPQEELQQFYEQNKGQMQGASFQQVENDIRNYMAQQKQNEVIEEYVDELSEKADVTLNEKWIEEQIALKPKNPLTDALKNGLPTGLDLGSDTCVPCQMMMPSFDELEKELKGKANVILLQIADYRALANEYKVRVIPTQIFFDQNGKQYWRHEGFLSKEDILKKLRETGANL